LNQKLNNIFITGSTGFVGKNLLQQLDARFSVTKFERGSTININDDIVIHLAGKSHDLKKTANPDQYYQVNTDFTKDIFDKFLESKANVFITLSSVKAAADVLDMPLTEDYLPKPETHYGKSKLLAEQYILSKTIPKGKRFYILRPCMIHGPGNKGNLNLLYKIVSKGFPWPLGTFENKRSFCSIYNLCFVINELIKNDSIPSGVYNIADDEPIATNELIKLIAESQGKKYHIWNIFKSIIKLLSKLGDFFKLPLNSERLNKLTETYIVSNNKIIKAINKTLPLSAKEGLMKTLNSFNTNGK
jgi:nucleoside-diphosphate-sugar epimerase